MFTFIRNLLANNNSRGIRDNGVRVLSNEDIRTVLQRLEEGVPFANMFEGYHLFFFTSFVPWLSSAFLLVPVGRDAGMDEESEEDEGDEADIGVGDNSSDNTDSVVNASDVDFEAAEDALDEADLVDK